MRSGCSTIKYFRVALLCWRAGWLDTSMCDSDAMECPASIADLREGGRICCPLGAACCGYVCCIDEGAVCVDPAEGLCEFPVDRTKLTAHAIATAVLAALM